MNQLSRAQLADVKRYLSDVEFPARRRQLLASARVRGASVKIMSSLKHLPDHEYNSPREITRELKL